MMTCRNLNVSPEIWDTHPGCRTHAYIHIHTYKLTYIYIHNIHAPTYTFTTYISTHKILQRIVQQREMYKNKLFSIYHTHFFCFIYIYNHGCLKFNIDYNFYKCYLCIFAELDLVGLKIVAALIVKVEEIYLSTSSHALCKHL